MADGTEEIPVEAAPTDSAPAAPTQDHGAHDHDHADHDHAEHGGHGDEIHMPPNSIWPLVTAVGLTGTMLGLIFVWSSLLPIIVGLLVLAGGIVMWIKDARTEYSELH